MTPAAAWRRSRSRGFAIDPCRSFRSFGARRLSQLQDNLASFELTLSADQLKTLDEGSAIELGSHTKCMQRRCREQSAMAVCATRSWHRRVLRFVRGVK